ncbi:hypothetical protein B0T11DRAFT_273783 [Plectosphaerella cucumerina]|uniref:Uncharacterized protein n=1 Tax=Plectosphaerella cucumerina TaxID=40658 RepID=A0A8K0XAI9_9PEZI|nr:hypothetical protein B0T11DRAFT_273783 [Plectosphaerella cucumerina]
MAAPHWGLPLPAAMTLPPQQPRHLSNAPPPPPPVPPAVAKVGLHHGHPLSQLPGPPPQWQGGAEGCMKTWLRAKAEEEKRRQEEERTKQESYLLEQRKLEAEMLRTSLDRGIPPPIVPFVFAGMGGTLSEAALELAKQNLSSPAPGQTRQLMAHHAERSPEQRSPQSQCYMSYAPVPSTPSSASSFHGCITDSGSPTTKGTPHTMSSTGSTGRPVAPTSHLPSINTSAAQGGPLPPHQPQQIAQPPPQHPQQVQQPSSAQQKSQASPGIFFHHWQPPSSHIVGPSQSTSASGAANMSKRKRDSL